VTVCGSGALTINVLIQKNEDGRGRFGTPKRLSDRGVWSKACPASIEDSARKKWGDREKKRGALGQPSRAFF
jgi:hypothetical protein